MAAPLGRPFTLECVATGNPVPTGRWLRNGRDIVMGTRFISQSREGTLKLDILEASDADEGDLHLPEHDNTKIKILYSGDQPADVTLTKDGHKVSEKDAAHLKYTVFDDYILIFIKDITKDDMGTYKVTIKNNSGEASDTFSVTVTGLPGPPQGPLETTDITKHSCTLAWKPPTYDGGLPVTHYVIERNDTSVRDTRFTVQGLTEGQEYNFRIHAANENGVGPALQGYWVDKREVGASTWQRVNAMLCLPNQLNCSNLVEGRQYEFR
ncbi:Twitchin, partial [Operophtera brumata]